VGHRSPGSQRICQRTKRLSTTRALAERPPLFALCWLYARVGTFTVRSVGGTLKQHRHRRQASSPLDAGSAGSTPPNAPWSTPATVHTERVALVSVSGGVVGAGLGELREGVDAVLRSAEVRGLMIDLSGVSCCDAKLFALLGEAHGVLVGRGGWLGLVGLSAPVLDSLESAELSQVLLISRASMRDFARDRVPAPRGG
jgi:anti-anti-sigma regulatory factor